MAEPTTVYSITGEAQTVVSPSEVRRLEAEGWTREAPKPEENPKFIPVPKQPGKGK